MKSNDNEISRLNRQAESLESRARILRERVLTLQYEDTKAAEARHQATSAKRKANRLAKQHEIPIDDEVTEYDRIAVWAPKKLDNEARDPFYGDHFVYSWPEALERVEAYVEALSK